MLTKYTRLLILVRHGEARSTEEDPARPLSTDGMVQAERMASWLAELGPEVDEVRHSGKARAQQTAYVFATRLGLKPSLVRGVSGMAPNDEPTPVARALEAGEESIVLVGHLPFLAKLASLLIVGDPSRVSLRFADAGVVALARVGSVWQVVAVLSPEMI
jgi:phosphohistidine phosphatase